MIDQGLATFADLRGKAAFVTGGSRGLGRMAAAHLAAQGVRIVIGARDRARLQTSRDALVAAGAECEAVTLDVTRSDSVASAVSEVEGVFGGIDILINNSGVAIPKPAFEQAESDWDRVVDTNLKGSWLVACRVADGMRRRGRGGSIVNMASIVGLRTAGQLAPYAASKAGLVHLTRQLAMEWARFGIRVNALAPGYFATDMNDDLFQTEAGQQLVRRVPQRRLGEAGDLAGPLLLLASEASRFVTGAVIPVDGGHSCAPL